MGRKENSKYQDPNTKVQKPKPKSNGLNSWLQIHVLHNLFIIEARINFSSDDSLTK
jgi:hypothetical protein